MTSRSAKSPLIAKWLLPLFWGLGVGLVVGTLLLMLTAKLVQSAEIPLSALAPLAVIAVGIGCFLAGLVAALVAKERGLLLGAMCGTLTYLLLLLVGLFRFGGVAGGYALIKWAVLTVCGAGGGLVGVNRKRH